MEKTMQWLEKNGNSARQYTWYSDDHYKVTFASGHTYEYSRKQIDYNRYMVTIQLDGKTAHKAIYTDTWLDNGNYGARMIEDLTGTVAA